MIEVNGWFSANQRRPSGMEAVGTKPLPRNRRSIRNIGRLLAVSTLRVDMPSATESQVIASVVSASRPAAATHAARAGRRPEPDEQGDAHDRGRAPAPSG